MKVAVMGCMVNGPGESKHANLGISLPGTFEEPVAPVYIDGTAFAMTLRGDAIVAEFIDILNKYVDSHYACQSVNAEEAVAWSDAPLLHAREARAALPAGEPRYPRCRAGEDPVSGSRRCAAGTGPAHSDARRDHGGYGGGRSVEGAARIRRQTLKNTLGRIEDAGRVVKDLDVGLVDFPTLYRGQEVYLCWRMDEPISISGTACRKVSRAAS
jgi:hypothetical protein